MCSSLDGPAGPGADFADLHAWCEVYLPGAGWIGLDPTSGLLAGEGHIPLACTPEPSSAAPVTEPGRRVRSQVRACAACGSRLGSAARHETLHRSAVDSRSSFLGQAIDEDLAELDVRLTMGGEPTFVSVDDPDGAEWNTAALGER